MNWIEASTSLGHDQRIRIPAIALSIGSCLTLVHALAHRMPKDTGSQAEFIATLFSSLDLSHLL